jgi:hypothetical protein
MRPYSLDPTTSAQLALRIRRIRAEYCLTAETANELSDGARAILGNNVLLYRLGCDLLDYEPERGCNGSAFVNLEVFGQ